MPTKEELATDAIAKAQKLEVELSGLKSSLLTLRWLCQYIGLPLLFILASAAIGGLVWTIRLGHSVESMEKQLKKLDDRIESTRDNILIRREEAEGTFVKLENNRVYLGSDEKIVSYAIAPSYVTSKDFENLKPGMRIRLSLAQSIDGNTFVIFVHDFRIPKATHGQIPVPP